MFLTLYLRVLNSRVEVTVGDLGQLLLIVHMNLLLLLRVSRMHRLSVSPSTMWYLGSCREHHGCLSRRYWALATPNWMIKAMLAALNEVRWIRYEDIFPCSDSSSFRRRLRFGPKLLNLGGNLECSLAKLFEAFHLSVVTCQEHVSPLGFTIIPLSQGRWNSCSGAS